MKVLNVSRLFLVASIVLGLLFAWNAYSAQQTEANLVGGCDYEMCEDNTATNSCPDECDNDWLAAQGSGDNYVWNHTFCTSGTGCSEETKVESTYCTSSRPS